MAIFNGTYCQICERFIAEEQWNKLFNSSGHLNIEVNDFLPDIFLKEN